MSSEESKNSNDNNNLVFTGKNGPRANASTNSNTNLNNSNNNKNNNNNNATNSNSQNNKPVNLPDAEEYDEFYELEKKLLDDLDNVEYGEAEVTNVSASSTNKNQNNINSPSLRPLNSARGSSIITNPRGSSIQNNNNNNRNNPKRESVAYQNAKNISVGDVDELLSDLGVAGQPVEARPTEEDKIYSFIQQFPPAPLGTCHRCRKSCGSGYIIIGDRSYHDVHFVCAGCNVPLSPTSYYPMVKGELICLRCEGVIKERKQRYQTQLGVKPEIFGANNKNIMICGKCGNPVGGAFLEAFGKLWHNDCFTCTKCGDDLLGMGIGGKSFPKDGQPYCEGCYMQSFHLNSSFYYNS